MRVLKLLTYGSFVAMLWLRAFGVPLQTAPCIAMVVLFAGCVCIDYGRLRAKAERQKVEMGALLMKDEVVRQMVKGQLDKNQEAER